MSITGVLIAALIVGGTGVFIGVFLGIAGKKFAVEVDEKEEAILAELPGNNCGGCGYAGCSGLAAAIAKGEAPVGQCPVGGAPVAAKIAAIMGEEAGESVHEVAFVKCAGTCEKAKQAYDYTGITDCQMAAMMQNGGPKGCSFGCLGFGNHFLQVQEEVLPDPDPALQNTDPASTLPDPVPASLSSPQNLL